MMTPMMMMTLMMMRGGGDEGNGTVEPWPVQKILITGRRWNRRASSSWNHPATKGDEQKVPAGFLTNVFSFEPKTNTNGLWRKPDQPRPLSEGRSVLVCVLVSACGECETECSWEEGRKRQQQGEQEVGFQENSENRMPQNEHIELFQKRYRKRLDHEEKTRNSRR